MAAVVVIDDGRGLRIEAHRKHQPNKSKLLFHSNFPFKWVYISSKTEHFSYKGGCGGHGHTCIVVFKKKSCI